MPSEFARVSLELSSKLPREVDSKCQLKDEEFSPRLVVNGLSQERLRGDAAARNIRKREI
jgi:hypothetical protein